MRTRLLVVAALAGAALAGAVLAVLVLGGDDPVLAPAEREAVAAALADSSGAGDGPAGSSRALDAVEDLVADPEAWGHIVAAGDTDLATLLDRAQPALGSDDDGIGRAEEDRVALAQDVIAPLVAGDAVADDVLAAVGRWTWPLLAVDLADPAAAERAATVLARADAGDDERDAVGGGVVLARTHRLVSSPVDGFDAIAAWRSDLARAAVAGADEDDVRDRTSALVDGDFRELPAPLARGILASWGAPTPASEPLRAAIAAHEADGPVRAGSVRTIAAHLAVIDATDDLAASRVAVTLAEEADDLVELEDDLLGVDDPDVQRVGEPATLLMAA